MIALNSYENRVYQIQLDDASFVVAKFYRPARWSRDQILEEHELTAELAARELPCVDPLRVEGETLFDNGDFLFAVYPRHGGRAPDIEDAADLEVLARTIARIHGVARSMPFQYRRAMDAERMGAGNVAYLLENDFVPAEMISAFETTARDVLELVTSALDHAPRQTIHGDCHLGNVLWRDETPNFVDFDDATTGPPIQDLWMLLSGERHAQEAQLGTILDAYTEFYDFDVSTLRLIEPLRTLRMLHHSAWIARRWTDPAFPIAFPWFGSVRYWSDQVLALREQHAALQEPALSY